MSLIVFRVIKALSYLVLLILVIMNFVWPEQPNEVVQTLESSNREESNKSYLLLTRNLVVATLITISLEIVDNLRETVKESTTK